MIGRAGLALLLALLFFHTLLPCLNTVELAIRTFATQDTAAGRGRDIGLHPCRLSFAVLVAIPSVVSVFDVVPAQPPIPSATAVSCVTVVSGRWSFSVTVLEPVPIPISLAIASFPFPPGCHALVSSTVISPTSGIIISIAIQIAVSRTTTIVVTIPFPVAIIAVIPVTTAVIVPVAPAGVVFVSSVVAVPGSVTVFTVAVASTRGRVSPRPRRFANSRTGSLPSVAISTKVSS